MRKLISNSTNLPLTKNEATKVIVKAAVASAIGLTLTIMSYAKIERM